MKSASFSDLVIVKDTLLHALFLFRIESHHFKWIIVHDLCLGLALLLLHEHGYFALRELFYFCLGFFIYCKSLAIGEGGAATEVLNAKIAFGCSWIFCFRTLQVVPKCENSTEFGLDCKRVFGRLVHMHNVFYCRLLAQFLFVRHFIAYGWFEIHFADRK